MRGDAATEALWTDVRAYLRGPVRIVVVGLDGWAVQRAVNSLRAAAPGREVEGIVLLSDESIVADPRWLRAHAMVWSTGPPSPLGAADRAAMNAVLAHGAPAERAVWLAELEVLGMLSDAPSSEAAAVRSRAESLTDWPVITEVGGWLGSLGTLDRRAREQQVAAYLCGEAARRLRAEAEASADAADAIDRVLAQDDAKVAEAVARAQREAARVLGAARRHAEAVRTDWEAFVDRLVAALPSEIASTPSDALDESLGPWLEHVVSGWLRDRLARYRAELATDLAETADADATACAAIAVPAVHAGVRPERDWARRLGVTAALGGGAVLLFTPAWPLGLAAVGGTLWYARGERTPDPIRRAEQATKVLQRVRSDVAQRISEQLDAVQQALDALADRRKAAAHAQGGDDRARLVAQAAAHRADAEKAHQRADEVAASAG